MFNMKQRLGWKPYKNGTYWYAVSYGFIETTAGNMGRGAIDATPHETRESCREYIQNGRRMH